MVEHLQAGESVLVFPEGTTSSGLAVLPMHGLLLTAARDAGVPVQPVTIGLSQPPTCIEIVFHPPVTADQPVNELTRHIHQEISAGLKRIHSGEFDTCEPLPVRTAAGPGLSRLP